MLDASPPIVARGEKILSLDPEVDMPAQSALSSPLEVLAPGCRTADPDGEAHEGALDGPGSLLGFSPSVHASFSENTANVRSRRARDEYSRFMTGIGITFRGVEGVWRVTAVKPGFHEVCLKCGAFVHAMSVSAVLSVFICTVIW